MWGKALFFKFGRYYMGLTLNIFLKFKQIMLRIFVKNTGKKYLVYKLILDILFNYSMLFIYNLYFMKYILFKHTKKFFYKLRAYLVCTSSQILTNVCKMTIWS